MFPLRARAADRNSAAPTWQHARFALSGLAVVAGVSFTQPSCSVVVDLEPLQAGGACPKGLADCNGDPSDGCERDLLSNPQSCGACGHDCLGGSCSNGLCGPTVLGPGSTFYTDMVVSDSAVYVLSGKSGIVKVPKTGGARLDIDADADGTQSFSLALGDGDLYWTRYDATPGMGAIRKAGRDGGGVTDIYTSMAVPVGLTLDTTALYWGNISGGLLTGAFDGTGAHEIGHTKGAVVRIVKHGDSLFFVAQTPPDKGMPANPGYVGQIPVGGGQVAYIAENEALPVDIAAYGDYVYWLNDPGPSAGQVKRAKIGCSPCAPEILADGQDWPFHVRVDKSGIYWLNRAIDLSPDAQQTITPVAQLVKAPLKGGAPVVLVDHLLAPGTLALDDQFIYFSDYITGIQRVAK